jgi:hypothetical protein
MLHPKNVMLNTMYHARHPIKYLIYETLNTSYRSFPDRSYGGEVKDTLDTSDRAGSNARASRIMVSWCQVFVVP